MAAIDQILNDLASLLVQEKELLTENVLWVKRGKAGFDQLEYVAPISVGGVIRSGMQARITCRSDLPDEDVHAQLEVYVEALQGYAHVQRVGWLPNSPHTNNGSAPASLKFKTLKTRWYEFGLNRRLGVGGLRQTVVMIAQPFPREVTSFQELLVFLEEIWKVLGVRRVPHPPWEGRLV
jgi:hypothetical protein